MNVVFKILALGVAVASIAGCSDSINTEEPKKIVDPWVDLEEPDFSSLKRRAEAGDAAAQNELGLRYEEGKGVLKDDIQAASWRLKASNQGNPDALLWTGFSQCAKSETDDDYRGALELIKKAADQNLGRAQTALALLYLGKNVEKSNFTCFSKLKDEPLGIVWLEKAAAGGDPIAQFELGAAYDDGVGMPENSAKAVEWYRKAAEQGQVDAQFNLGWAYHEGEGVPKDAAQAVAWYRKAAEQGHANAQNNLGWAYDNGKGVPKDDAQAVAWYRKAAEQGLANAQYGLGTYYAQLKEFEQLKIDRANGNSNPLRDPVQAYMWFNLAAAQGLQGADKEREFVARWLSPKQLAEAQRLTREWKPGQHTESPSSTGGISGSAMEKALTGTAFVVSNQGHLLTNRHVVGNCQQVRLAGSDKPLKVLPQDEANDLALLQMIDKPKAVAVFRAANDLRQGESIAAYGYPLQGALAAGGNLSPGVVSALAGLGNNTSQIQITAPVQQGNSGGPVLDGKGQVVGVVVQKLDAVKVAKLTGDVPQNVNFAINESTTRAFLDSNQVQYKTGGWWNFGQKDLADIAEDARTYTVVVECWK
jgi:TPR repeat protein